MSRREPDQPPTQPTPHPPHPISCVVRAELAPRGSTARVAGLEPEHTEGLRKANVCTGSALLSDGRSHQVISRLGRALPRFNM